MFSFGRQSPLVRNVLNWTEIDEYLISLSDTPFQEWWNHWNVPSSFVAEWSSKDVAKLILAGSHYGPERDLMTDPITGSARFYGALRRRMNRIRAIWGQLANTEDENSISNVLLRLSGYSLTVGMLNDLVNLGPRVTDLNRQWRGVLRLLRSHAPSELCTSRRNLPVSVQSMRDLLSGDMPTRMTVRKTSLEVTIRTDPIVLRTSEEIGPSIEKPLGQLLVSWGFMGRTIRTRVFSQLYYDGWSHPHVSFSGELCAGNQTDLLEEELRSGQLLNAWTIIHQVLKSYNPISAYQDLCGLATLEDAELVRAGYFWIAPHGTFSIFGATSCTCRKCHRNYNGEIGPLNNVLVRDWDNVVCPTCMGFPTIVEYQKALLSYQASGRQGDFADHWPRPVSEALPPEPSHFVCNCIQTLMNEPSAWVRGDTAA